MLPRTREAKHSWNASSCLSCIWLSIGLKFNRFEFMLLDVPHSPPQLFYWTLQANLRFEHHFIGLRYIPSMCSGSRGVCGREGHPKLSVILATVFFIIENTNITSLLTHVGTRKRKPQLTTHHCSISWLISVTICLGRPLVCSLNPGGACKHDLDLDTSWVLSWHTAGSHFFVKV